MHSPALFRIACLMQIASLFATVGGAQHEFHFSVTADMRWEHVAYGEVLEAMNNLMGGQGAFQISTGDIDGGVWDNRAVVDTWMGTQAIWIPGIGNHEAEDAVEMDWIRAEYDNGNGERISLADFVSHAGPDGSSETTYSWNFRNAHFIYLNQYWDGSNAPGSDVATDGDVVPELRDWLAADLAANTRPAIFVFGHEPAFPMHRHLNDSLNKYEANRDAFWALLEEESVMAYICGHTHVFSTYRHGDGRVLQIDVGNAGNDTTSLDGQSFIAVSVGAAEVEVVVCRNQEGPFSCNQLWTEQIPILFKDGFESGDLLRW